MLQPVQLYYFFMKRRVCHYNNLLAQYDPDR